MNSIPDEIKLTYHAQQRLEERNLIEYKYNIENIIKSPCKWYGKDDLIHDCALYRHCCYTCRKSNQIGYITDGEIEIIYNKITKIAITILNVKDKFKPIIQYIKPELLNEIKIRKEKIKMSQNKFITKGLCADCGKEENLNADGICVRCVRRKINSQNRGKEYVRYLDLTEQERNKIDAFIEARNKKKRLEEAIEEPISIEAPDSENYYQSKAEQEPIKTHPVKTIENLPETLEGQLDFVKILRECGCEIPEENLKEVLNVLLATNKLKDIFMTIADSDNQDTLLDLDQSLNVAERKLQHNWEYNGFQEADDIKFKGFLTWRRMLKGAIFFWKKLYQTNTLIELQKAWHAYTADPSEKPFLSGDKPDSTLKRYQITTESISTIFNTRRPFTRVFYAQSQEKAYEIFVKWMADRQLHENKAKTTIVELTSEGENVKNGIE